MSGCLNILFFHVKAIHFYSLYWVVEEGSHYGISAAMLDPGLVLALGAFFHVHTLFVCVSDGDKDYPDLPENITRDFVINKVAWPVSLVNAQDMSAALADYRMRESGSAVALAVCQHFDLAVKNLVEADLYSDIVWLAPQDSIESNFDLIPLRLDSFLLGYSGDSNYSIILENYSIKRFRLMTSDLGVYMNGTLNVTGDYVWERRRDFKGTKVINTVLPWSPMIMVDEETMETSGLFPDVLKVIENYYNFRKACV